MILQERNFVNHLLNNNLLVANIKETNIDISDFYPTIGELSISETKDVYIVYKNVFGNSYLIKEDVIGLYLRRYGDEYIELYYEEEKIRVIDKFYGIVLRSNYGLITLIQSLLYAIVIMSNMYKYVSYLGFLFIIISIIIGSYVITNKKIIDNETKIVNSLHIQRKYSNLYNKYHIMYILLMHVGIILMYHLKNR